MKKTLSVILVAVMVLSTLVSLVVPAAAAEEATNTGKWKVELAATNYDDDAVEENIPPMPGWNWDSTGFHTVSPDYKNYNPKFTVVSTEELDIKNFSMKVKVHDYAFVGDNWFSFSVWSKSNGLAQGDTSGKYGYGWTSLIRSSAVKVGDETKNALTTFQSFDMGAKRNGGTNFNQIGNVALENPSIPDENNDMIIEFAIVNGEVKVNGTVIGKDTDDCIAKSFSNGLGYVAVTLHNSDATGTYKPTISILEVNGEVPEGTGSAAPEEKSKDYGPMIDSTTVAPGTPAIWFGAAAEGTTNEGRKPSGGVCDVTYTDNGDAFKVTVNSTAHYFQFSVPNKITYEATDFTWVAYIFRNLCTCNLDEGQTIHDCNENESGGIRFCAGEVTAPNDQCSQSVGYFMPITSAESVDADGNYTGDRYTIALIKVENEMWKGRIHNIRIDIGGYTNYNVEGKNTYDLIGAGIFRNGNDIHDFVNTYGDYKWDSTLLDAILSTIDDEFTYGNDGEIPDDGDDDASNEGTTTVPEEESTTVGEEVTTAAPAVTTEAPANEKSGCGSVVSLGAIAIVTVACGAGFVARKKKED